MREKGGETMAIRYLKIDGVLHVEDVQVVRINGMDVRRVQRYIPEHLDEVEQTLEKVLDDGEAAVAKRDSKGRAGYVVIRDGKPVAWMTITPSEE
jgi:hypothetical protein